MVRDIRQCCFFFFSHKNFRLHFIPLSSTYKEIYNIYAYFSGPTSSILTATNVTIDPEQAVLDVQLRKIAEAGKHWKRTIGRKVDMEGKFLFCFVFFVVD
jgi:hypothetical protein